MSMIEQLLAVRVSEGPNRWAPADVRRMLYDLYHQEYEDGCRSLTTHFRTWVITNTDQAADELFDCIYACNTGLNSDNPYFLYEDCISAHGGSTLCYEGCILLTRICNELPLYSKCKVTITPSMMITFRKDNFVYHKQMKL